MELKAFCCIEKKNNQKFKRVISCTKLLQNTGKKRGAGKFVSVHTLKESYDPEKLVWKDDAGIFHDIILLDTSGIYFYLIFWVFV